MNNGAGQRQETARWAFIAELSELLLTFADLQQQYTTYKNNLQALAQRIGEVEQEAEEHKSVTFSFRFLSSR